MAWIAPLIIATTRSQEEETEQEKDNRRAAAKSRDYFAKRDKEREDEREYWKGRK